MTSFRRVFIAILVVTALWGCAKTKMTNLWMNPQPGAPVGSILVISLERDDDLRRAWEDAFSAEFQANGVMSRPGYSLFPAALPDSQQVVVVTNRDDYDGVFVIHRIAGAYTESLDSGDYRKNAPGGSDNYWRGWYHTHFMQASSSAPFDEGEARFQIDLANTAGRGTLLWTGRTVEVDPRKMEKVQKEICGELVTELIRRDFVAKRK